MNLDRELVGKHKKKAKRRFFKDTLLRIKKRLLNNFQGIKKLKCYSTSVCKKWILLCVKFYTLRS